MRPIRWTSPSLEVSPESRNYREIQTWFEFSNAVSISVVDILANLSSNNMMQELRDWGNRYKTSWFRVAVALVGVLIRSISEPDGGADHAITVAFGGRPAGMENSVGQFANALPIRVPLADILSSKSPTFEALVKSVSKEVSTAKKHDRLSYLDVADAYRALGLPAPRAQVAITLSPKLSHEECSVYPVEGPYDLFFCFLEAEKSVSLGVS